MVNEGHSDIMKLMKKPAMFCKFSPKTFVLKTFSTAISQ